MNKIEEVIMNLAFAVCPIIVIAGFVYAIKVDIHNGINIIWYGFFCGLLGCLILYWNKYETKAS